jgi:hypothetical protein
MRLCADRYGKGYYICIRFNTKQTINKHMKTKTLLLVIIATLGLTASTMAQNLPNYVPANGLVGWWPFNGNANDESGNGYNGIVTDATLTNDRFGNENNAYAFNGTNDYIDLLDSNLLNDFSVNLWIKPNMSSSRNTIISKFTNNSSFPNGWEALIDFNTNIGELVIGNAVVGTYSTTVDTGVWYNVCFVYDYVNLTMNTYLNGALIHNDTAFIVNPNNVLFRIGARSNTPPIFFYNGIVDDVGIWNHTLNQQEITDLHNGNSVITGFNSATQNNTIKIYPNPSNNHITIDYGDFATVNGYQLKIQNSIGQQIFQTNITQQTDYLSLNNCGGNGLYFVHIIDAQGNNIDIRKIVLQ